MQAYPGDPEVNFIPDLGAYFIMYVSKPSSVLLFSWLQALGKLWAPLAIFCTFIHYIIRSSRIYFHCCYQVEMWVFNLTELSETRKLKLLSAFSTNSVAVTIYWEYLLYEVVSCSHSVWEDLVHIQSICCSFRL